MAANSNVTDKQGNKQDIAKGRAKREYLLTDEDLEDLEYETRDNPLNKLYPPMKIFKLSEVECRSVEVWGSAESLENEKLKRKHQKIKQENKNEDSKRKFWDCGDIYEPLKQYMDRLELPKAYTEPGKQGAEGLLECDIILCYSDCMNSRPPGAFGRRVLKEFPSIADVNKSTPYNDRKKMGHFCWCMNNTDEREQLVVNLYVVHKWSISSKSRASLPVLEFDALALALRRFSTLLTDTLDKQETPRTTDLSIGTYIPYKVDPEQFQKMLTENLQFPVQTYSTLESKAPS